MGASIIPTWYKSDLKISDIASVQGQFEPVCRHRSQWQRPQGLTSPTDEDAAEAEAGAGEAEAVAAEVDVGAAPKQSAEPDAEPLQPTGASFFEFWP